MRTVYVKSIHVQMYTNGNIWGVILCNDVATKRVIKVKGVLERYPVAGDIIVFDEYTIERHSQYGECYNTPFMQVSYPVDPSVLPKYLHATKITDIHGFGPKKMSMLLSDPDNLWNVLAKQPDEWGDAYTDIPSEMKQKLHANFETFRKQCRSLKTLEIDLTLLLIRMKIRTSRTVIRKLVDYIKPRIVNGEECALEQFLQDHILDLVSVIPTHYVQAIAEAFQMDDDIRACIDVMDALCKNEEDGHTWIPKHKIRVCASASMMDRAIEYLSDKGYIFVHGKRVFRRITYEQEGFIARFLADLNSQSSVHAWIVGDLDSSLHYTVEQNNAMRNAFTNRVSVLTGGPGTGKTSTIVNILSQLEKYGLLNNELVILAPTGKAVSRIMSMMTKGEFENGKVTISTIHRFIYAAKQRPEHVTFVIVDEMSMVDIPTMAKCFEVLDTYTDKYNVLLTGDPDQLPSIRCGNILHDIIQSDVLPRVYLTQVLRQENGGYLMNAIGSIRDGEPPRFPREVADYKYEGDDITKALTEIATEFKDKPTDVMVITPMNSTIRKYQQVLRGIMNPSASRDDPLTEGDRVIQCVNVYNEDDEASNRFNGMMGTIQHIKEMKFKRTNVVNGEKRIVEEDHSKVSIEYDNDMRQQMVVPLEDAKMELELAYILTVHKSQGSQAKKVVVVLEDYGDNTCIPTFITRNLIYTAVSRAEKCCVVVGSLDTYAFACRNVLPKRRTCLAQWLSDMTL